MYSFHYLPYPLCIYSPPLFNKTFIPTVSILFYQLLYTLVSPYIVCLQTILHVDFNWFSSNNYCIFILIHTRNASCSWTSWLISTFQFCLSGPLFPLIFQIIYEYYASYSSESNRIGDVKTENQNSKISTTKAEQFLLKNWTRTQPKI